MKNWRKVAALVLALAMVLTLVACGGNNAPASSTPAESKPAESTPAESKPAESKPAESKPEESKPEEPPAEEEGEVFSEDTPRNETIYLGGRQYSKPTNMNPMSPQPNFTPISQNDYSDEWVYETLYMFNSLDGKPYPLLADGDWAWNADLTEVTVKIKPAAKWSDGTQVTAADVAATFDAHVKYESANGANYGQYIAAVEATDDATAVFKCVSGEKYNPIVVEEYLCKIFVMQKAYLEKLDAELGGDKTEMKNATMWDAPHTGAYNPTLYDSEQKWICTRRDDYWGQDASMWGKLPVPKYIVHNIYKANENTALAFRKGQVDINQQYMANLQDTWQKDGLPISTYYEEAPYQDSIGMPTCIMNTTLPGLDQASVRKAIAMAVDFEQIISSAMTGQSYTFKQIPRSLFNGSAGEQALIKDKEALKPLQFEGNDVAGAIALLDEAGVVDTDNDGVREYPAGNNLTFKCMCPTGWSDWEAAMNIVATAGQNIGINLETYFPESKQYTADIQAGNFEISMTSYSATGIANPWTRMYNTLYGFGGNFPETMVFNYGRYYNPECDEILTKIPTASDEEKLDLYQKLNEIYLTEVPAFALMYRPAVFHEVNESVWTNYPDASNNPKNIPPMLCTCGYGYAGLFELELVNG